MEDLLKDLNDDQREAVTHDRGPLLIIAGAGTGKTTVITRRIAWLIAQKKALPEEILALTFTDKAAAEMEERVDSLVPYGFFDSWISTFHAFGDRILRENALELGLPPDFKVLTFPEQMIFLKEHLFELDLKILRPISNPTRHLEALLKYFSRLKDEDISPKEFLNKLKAKSERLKIKENSKDFKKYLEVAYVYEKYEELMMKSGFLDFGDQIRLALKLFRENPHILKRYQEKFKYILVDEYQDTNYAQGELIKLLGAKDSNITVVADDDQSIYRFRGAAFYNVLDFKNHYKKARQIVLNINYRSTKEILDSSYRLIQFNNPDRLEVKGKISKRLISEKSGPEVRYIFADTLSSEADEVAKIIQKKLKEGVAHKDIAILVRKNSQANPFIHALNFLNIPYKFSGSFGLYSRPEIKIILSFINSVSDPFDSLSLFYLITSDIYKVDIKDAIYLSSSASRENKSLEEKLRYPGLEINESSIDKIKRVIDDLDRYRNEFTNSTAGQIIYSFLKETGYLRGLVKEAEKNPEAEVKIQNIAKFFKKVTDFEFVSQDKSLLNFKGELNLLIEVGDDPATAEIDPDIDAVNIITIHKAKGLEYEVVFMVNLVDGDFPARKLPEYLKIPDELIKEKLPEGDFHIQEERRLFYVGMTRAKTELYLTFAEDYGKTRSKKVSPFVLEALNLSKIEGKKKKSEKIELIKRFEKTKIPEAIKQFYNGEGVLNLSPYGIDDYLSCPLKFKFIHILKIPIIRHHTVVYGSAIHQAIGEYFLRKIRSRDLSTDYASRTKEKDASKIKDKLQYLDDPEALFNDIIKVYENAWVSEGFIHRQHEKESFLRGKEVLKNFFESQEREKRLPSSVEEKFSFVIEEGDLKVKVNGRYDAVYDDSEITSQGLMTGDKDSAILDTISTDEQKTKGPTDSLQNFQKENHRVEIRDFKTSEIDEKEKADHKAKINRQLSIYALSYKELKGKIPELLTLHFVDSGIIGESQRREKDLEKIRAEILSVAKGITENRFEAKPGYGECSRCVYRDVCSYTEGSSFSK